MIDSTLARCGRAYGTFDVCGLMSFRSDVATSTTTDAFSVNLPKLSLAKGDSSMAGDAASKRPIQKRLDAAALDLNAAARLLEEPPNVLAANHLQQAAEKILGAVRLHRGLVNTKDHDLALLIDGRAGGGEPLPLPDGDPWRERFAGYEKLSLYATTFRYSLSPAPRIDDLRGMLQGLDELHKIAIKELL